MTTAAALQLEPPVSSAVDDPATEYAQRVIDGAIVAGPHVRNACARHLRDLEHGPMRGLVWDLDAARWAIAFFEEVLCLNGGQYEGQPFYLLDWQLFIVANLFGWKGPDGYRRFRIAYVETAKGSGKSPLAAGVGLYGLVADREQRAEVYAAATKKDQAMVLFRDAVAMVDQSPELAVRLHKSGAAGREWNIAYHRTSSFFRPIASDQSQSGPRPHVALLDEIHEHRDGTVVELMRAGTKSRRQALVFMITNSGSDRTSVCYDYHSYGRKVAAGMVEDDAFFAFVCSLDEDDKPFQDEHCWLKANPSLAQGIPGWKYLREQVTQARGMPSKEAVVKRLNFCVWTDAENPFITAEEWFGCEDQDYDPALLAGRRCWGGLDLSSTRDLTALVLLFEPTDADPYWRQREWFWLPGDGLADKSHTDRVPYDSWKLQGHVRALPGAAVDKRAVAMELVEIVQQYALVTINFDRAFIKDLERELAELGVSVPMTPFGQGFVSMAPAVSRYETLIVNRELRHWANPCMTWNAANVQVEMDAAGNRKFSKRRSNGRIDGMVAAVMAAAGAEAKPLFDVGGVIG